MKPVKLRLKIDLVSYPARAEGLVNSTFMFHSFFNSLARSIIIIIIIIIVIIITIIMLPSLLFTLFSHILLKKKLCSVNIQMMINYEKLFHLFSYYRWYFKSLFFTWNNILPRDIRLSSSILFISNFLLRSDDCLFRINLKLTFHNSNNLDF